MGYGVTPIDHSNTASHSISNRKSGCGSPATITVGDDPFDQWVEAVLRVLQLWV